MVESNFRNLSVLVVVVVVVRNSVLLIIYMSLNPAIDVEVRSLLQSFLIATMDLRTQLAGLCSNFRLDWRTSILKGWKYSREIIHYLRYMSLRS